MLPHSSSFTRVRHRLPNWPLLYRHVEELQAAAAGKDSEVAQLQKELQTSTEQVEQLKDQISKLEEKLETISMEKQQIQVSKD